MPLEFQLVQAPLRLGLSEGVDPHQSPFGTLMTAENVCWERTGHLGKRLGTTALSTGIVGGGNLTSARRLIVRGNELAVTDGSKIYSRSASGWVDRGRLPELGLDWSTSVDTILGVSAADAAPLSNGQVVEAWVTGDPSRILAGIGALQYQIREIDTGVLVVPPTLISAPALARFRLLASGTTWIVLWIDSNTGTLYRTTSAGTAALKTDAADGPASSLDACLISPTEFVVAYALNAGGIRLVRYTVSTTPVEQATDVVTGEAAFDITSISIAGAAGETLYITYFRHNAEDVRFAAANPSTLAQTVAPFDVVNSGGTSGVTIDGTVAVARESATSCLLVYSISSDTDEAAGITRSASITNAGVVTTGQEVPALRVLSRPFLVGLRFFCAVATDNLQSTFWIQGGRRQSSDTLLADVTMGGAESAFRLVGKIDALIGGCWNRGYVTSPAAASSSLTLLPIGYQSSPVTGPVGVRQGLRLVRVTSGDSVPADMWRSVTMGAEAYAAAGVLTSYDGLEALGYGWPYGPYIDRVHTSASASGGNMATGTYLYNVTAERRSAVGVLHRSPVGMARPIAVTGPTGRVTIGIAAASLGHSAIQLGQYPVYRSVVNGAIVQRLAVEPTYMTLHDPGLAYPATLTDTRPDASIGPDPTTASMSLATRPALYTEGGELEDTQPPAALTIAIHQNRLWMVAGDGRTVWFSKDASGNPGIAPGFHPTMTLGFEAPVVALLSLDDKLIAYGEDTFWLVVGQGPAPNGAGATYEVGDVQTDVGCTNPRSLVSTPDGHMFQCERGIYLLARDMTLVWVGRPVKDKLVEFPNITSAVLVAHRNEVRFTASNAGGTESVVLVFNYVEKQWTTSKYTVGGVYGAPIADACMFDGAWTFVTTGGVVVSEVASSHLDGSTWVPLTLETAWNNAGGPLAYQSARNFAIEGVSWSNHDLTISVGFDNEPSYAQTRTFTAGSPVTSIGPLESCTISIGNRRKCQSIRFRVQDAPPATLPVGSGQGPSFEMLGIEIGMKKGFATRSAQHKG